LADRFYSVVLFGSDNPALVVENAASQAGNVVEVRITYDAANNSKLRTIRAIETLAAFLASKETWPPV
jgi:hypothetical protein